LKKLVVFTDLDGTLLDHESYSWKPALPAMLTLQKNDYPIVVNSSKTSAEIQALRKDMNINSPFICENGSVVHLNQTMQQSDADSMVSVYFAEPYKHILKALNTIQKDHNFDITGFNDMDVNQVMALTGLDEKSAKAAKEREATEPLVWNDTDESLLKFTKLLQAHNLTLTKGGRFYHIMSPVNKGESIKYLMEKYRSLEPDVHWISAGLGDSYNDISMLEQVDFPVLIKNPHGNTPDVSHIENIIKSDLAGPLGWNIEVLNIINTIKGTQ